MPPRPRLLSSALRAHLRPSAPPSRVRQFSSAVSDVSQTSLPPPSPRWLSDLRARVGRCLMFGCDQHQTAAAATISKALATEWKELTAGSEGFLSGPRYMSSWEDHKVMWGEQDTFKHVNNVAYVRWAESSRTGWVTNIARAGDPAYKKQWEAFLTPGPLGLILKRITVDYKSVITYPDTISVYQKYISTLSDSEMHLGFLILSHRSARIAARGDEDLVVYDHVKGQRAAMPGFMTDTFRTIQETQTRETHRARARIRELEESVRGLEKMTWDRADAVEDVGQKK